MKKLKKRNIINKTNAYTQKLFGDSLLNIKQGSL